MLALCIIFSNLLFSLAIKYAVSNYYPSLLSHFLRNFTWTHRFHAFYFGFKYTPTKLLMKKRRSTNTRGWKKKRKRRGKLTKFWLTVKKCSNLACSFIWILKQYLIQLLNWKLKSLIPISASKHYNELDNLILKDLLAALYRFSPSLLI